MPSVLQRIAAQLSTDALVVALNQRQAELDEWQTAGVDPDAEPELRRERALVAALRAEYRTRTGEII